MYHEVMASFTYTPFTQEGEGDRGGTQNKNAKIMYLMLRIKNSYLLHRGVVEGLNMGPIYFS